MDAVTHPVESLPPSAKLVYKILEYEGECSAKQISEESLLPRQTTNAALKRLRKHEIVESKHDPQAPRRLIYRVRDGKITPNGEV